MPKEAHAERKVGTPLRYPGGKTRALEQIKAMIPARRFPKFVDPMVGGGSVYLLARQLDAADGYWINDGYEPVYAFWRTVRDPEANRTMRRRLKAILGTIGNDPKVARRFFEEYRNFEPGKAADDAALADLALSFFVINKVTFSGVFSNGGFSAEASVKRFTATSVERLEPLPALLDRTTVTGDDVLDVIPRIPDGSFVFLDPPYSSARNLYGAKGSHHNGFPHEELARVLSEHAHRFSFLMTYDAKVLELPAVGAAYGRFRVKPWSVKYSMGSWTCTQKMNPEEARSNGVELVRERPDEREWRSPRRRVKDAKAGDEVFIYNYADPRG